LSEILCLGGAGFIGSHLVDRLIKEGHSVTVVDDLSSGKLENLSCKDGFIQFSIRDFGKLRGLFQSHNFDYVFNLAAQINLRKSIDSPAFDAKTNIIGSIYISQLCKEFNTKCLYFVSTGGAIYDERVSLPWSETSPTNPKSPYGLAKKTAEEYIKLMDIPYNIFRLSNVFGERQNPECEAGVISIFTENCLNKKQSKIFGSGNQTRDFIYVKDVIDGMIEVFNSQRLNETWNISSNTQISVNELADRIAWLTEFRDFKYLSAISGELQMSILCNNKLKSIGWKQHTSLDDGLEKTIKWFKEKK